jgi:Tfp pilus assembly pilus retraction ATPase PilT
MSESQELRCTVCGAEARLESEQSDAQWCSEQCALDYFQSIGAAEEETVKTGFKALRDALEKSPKAAQEKFDGAFQKGSYAFKVMGYNRARLSTLYLDRAPHQAAVARLFSYQRVNRDFRGPWTGLRGGIVKAPTGAGKTVTLHTILGNYRRELVPARTPVRYYMKECLRKANC